MNETAVDNSRETLDKLVAETKVEAFAQKLDIKDGDVYLVKLKGEDIDNSLVIAFKKALKSKFPKVEFIVVATDPETDVEFTKLPKEKQS